MINKIYSGISGTLKIICGVFVGLIIGGGTVLSIGKVLPLINTSNVKDLLSSIWLLLALSSYAAMVFIGILQIKSMRRTCKINRAAVLFVEILASILIITQWSEFLYGALEFYSDAILVIAIILYVASIINMIVDAVVLIISICKDKAKIFNKINCADALIIISRAVIVSFSISLCLILRGYIVGNIEQMELFEAMNGGFDSFTMTDFDGNECTEDIFKGHKVTMINIWATFCHPCIEEMPDLEEISEMYDEKDLQIIGIPADLYFNGIVDDEQMAEAQNIIDKTGIKYTVLIPSIEIQAGVLSGVQGYPTTIFIDENGEQIRVEEGARSKDSWIKIIEETLADEK